MTKPQDRSALVRDADYFLREATHRLLALARHDGRNELAWKQAGALSHQARVAVREVIDRERRQRRLAA